MRISHKEQVRRSTARRRFLRHWGWLPALLVFDVFFVIWWRGRSPGEDAAKTGSPAEVPIMVAAPETLPAVPVVHPMQVGFPTAQSNLVLIQDASVFMPTAAGRVESAHYGSVRTASQGGRILPSFHEGIDIAPLTRDRRQRAMDPVMAIADGRVAHISAHSGNSNYGIYVVLEHEDPVGTIYSLYAHLSAVDKRVREGQRVRRGEVLGVLGNTPSSIIPVVRSHLHLEVGMIRTRRFSIWANGQKLDNRHGNYNGWNLTGINPLALYTTTDPVREFSMRNYLSDHPVAFELLINVNRPLDYFVRYPDLWKGEGEPSGALVLEVSEGGVILRGHRLHSAEQGSSSRSPQVLSVNRQVLGRNGLHLVVERSGQWSLGNNGKKWLEILLY